MKAIDSVKRQIILIFPIIGYFLISCASGPVTTEIDTNKNPVVQKPKDYQSPVIAIQSFSGELESSTRKDKELKDLIHGSLKALVMQQDSVASELNTTSKLKLKPGFSYEFTLESFCVHAGAVRPIKGDGLFLGDVEGAAKAWLPQILSQYKLKNIPQNEAQILIWSLLSGSRFDELSFENRKNLIKLFPDAVVRFGNSLVEGSAKNYLLSQIPSEVLSAKTKFDEYKNLLQDSKSKFSEIEQVLSPKSSRLSPIPVGWLKHEDGYYIQLKSDGYQKVHVQIYAPEGIKANTYFNPSKHVVLPGEGQRLALSSYVVDEANTLLGNLASDIVKWKTGHELTESEKQLILKYPGDALKIYETMSEAFKKTDELFKGVSKHNTSADAFRHFVWSGLSANTVGPGRAFDFLNAHENYAANPNEEKNMDMSNNLKGIEYYKNYKGNTFEEDLIRSGLEKVKNKELVWLI